MATTDNLNFGTPEKPEIMGQFVGCIKGIGEAVAALDMPIVSGNVSLYNETDGQAILPTPTIGAVGLLRSTAELIDTAPKAGDTLILIGETTGHLGQSALLKEMLNREDGDAPSVNLDAERDAGEFVMYMNASELITAAHDISDGGLAVALAEMAMAGDCGLEVQAGDTGWWFGEDQARFILSTSDPEAVLAKAKVPAAIIGTVSGSDLKLGDSVITLAELREAFETALPSAVA